MRPVAIIDCGTTNSRVYLVEKGGKVLAQATRKVGVRDTAIHGGNSVLKEGLRETMREALQRAQIPVQQVAFALGLGMISSEIGLVEVPHLWAPAGVDELAENLHRVREETVFPLGLPVYFVRGVKNRYDPDRAGPQDVDRLDFMRGEETQVIGLLAEHEPRLPLTVVVLSSHTKLVAVDSSRRIQGSVTTLSGQLYEAILRDTSVGKSIRPAQADRPEPPVDTAIVDLALRTVGRSGLPRALLLPRFLDTLLETQWHQRKVFVEAAIAAEDLRAVAQYASLGFPGQDNIVIVGSERRCRLYEYLLPRVVDGIRSTARIDSEEQIARLSIVGAMEIARRAGLIGQYCSAD